MSPSDLVSRFADVRTSSLPAVGELDDRLKAFWILRVAAEQLGETALTPAQISTVLRDRYGILLSRQRVEAILAAERGTVACRKRDGRRAYQLMAAGSAEVGSADSAPIFIDPGSGFSGLRQTHALLGAFRGQLRVCDPYAELRTLDMLAECAHVSRIELLTRNVKNAAGFKQALVAFAREHGIPVEVRVAPAGVLHDR